MAQTPGVSMDTDPVLTGVRTGHEFDLQTLDAWLQQAAPEWDDAPLDIEQFEGGQSNPTFRLTKGDQRYVLRKQPPGQLLPSAHQVDREYRVMKALQDTAVPVPRMIALCDDPAVLGVKFYVMEWVDGRVFTDTRLTVLEPAERSALYDDLVRVMAELHKVDYQAVGLEGFGKPGNYYTRQIGRWSKQYVASKTEQIDAMDKLMAWLPEQIPESDETVVVHGDFRLGNVLVHPTEPRIVAVLDWELCTLGHPLADLGYIGQDYHSEGYDGISLEDAAGASGIPTEDDLVAAYCRHAGRDGIDNWTFYLVYNMFRSAAIIQGVYKRGLDGNASSAMALEYKDACRARSETAWKLVEQRNGAG